MKNKFKLMKLIYLQKLIYYEKKTKFYFCDFDFMIFMKKIDLNKITKLI